MKLKLASRLSASVLVCLGLHTVGADAPTPPYEVVGAWTSSCTGVTPAHRGAKFGVQHSSPPFLCIDREYYEGWNAPLDWPGIDEYAELRFRARQTGEPDHFVEGGLACHHNAVPWAARNSNRAVRDKLDEWYCHDSEVAGTVRRSDGKWCAAEPHGEVLYTGIPKGRLLALSFAVRPATFPHSSDGAPYPRLAPYNPPYFGASCRYRYLGLYEDFCLGPVDVNATFGDGAVVESFAFATESYIAPDGRPGKVGSSRAIESVWLRLGSLEPSDALEAPTIIYDDGSLGYTTSPGLEAARRSWKAGNAASVRRFLGLMLKHGNV